MTAGPRYWLDGTEVDGVPPQFALYPYGAFTTFLAEAGGVLDWSRHARRLADATQELWGHPLDVEGVRDLVRGHLRQLSEPGPMSVRVTIFPEHFSLSRPSAASGARVLVSSAPAPSSDLDHETFAVHVVGHIRGLAHLKTTDLFSQVRLRREAQLAGYDDAILSDGPQLLEGTTWSLMVWHDHRVLIPAGEVLASITSAHHAALARKLGWAVEEGPLVTGDLAGARLVLAVNVAQPVRAITRIDARPLAVDKALQHRIAEAYRALPRELL